MQVNPPSSGKLQEWQPLGDLSAKATLWKTGAPLQSLWLAADWTEGDDCSSTVHIEILIREKGKIFMLMMLVKPQAGCCHYWSTPDAETGQLLASTHLFCFVRVMTRRPTRSRGTSKTNNFKCSLLGHFSNDDTSCLKYRHCSPESRDPV